MPNANPRGTKSANEVVTLATAAAIDATSTGTTAVKLPVASAYAFVCDLTAAASAVDDTLNVYVQTKLDGTNYVDVVAFTQILGNGGAKRYIAKVTPGAVAETMFENASALAAGSVRNLGGDDWRVRYVVVNGAGTHIFSFTVTAVPM